MTTTSSTEWQRPLITTLDRPKPDGAYFDADEADKAVRFFEMLPHIKGRWAGQRFKLQPWQAEEVIKPLFGWKRADGTRLYRECYIRIARKAGKSTMAAGVAGKLLFADGEPGAEIYSAAVDRDQARIVFGALSEMVLSSQKLNKRATVLRGAIAVEKTRSTYKALSADAPNKHGLNAHGVIVDELHAHPKRDLFDVLSTSTGSREQPIVFSITTAGVWNPDSICLEKEDYTRAIALGHIDDPAFLGVVYAVGDDDDWQDPATWIKANPGLGVTIFEDYLARERDKARASVAAQNTFRMLHCGQWVQQAERWLDLDLWDRNAGSVIEPDLTHRRAWGGLDLGSVSDLSAWVLVFPMDDGTFKVLPRFFAPEAAVQSGPNATLYREFVQRKLLTLTPGNATDYAFVRERILKDSGKFWIERITMDHAFQGGQLAGELIDGGLEVRAFRNVGYTDWGPCTRELERLLLEEKLQHGANPVLRWMADNVIVKRSPEGFLKPDRTNAVRNKIDGIAALVMALQPLTEQQYAGDPGVLIL